jgi:hypothetical protein
MMHQDFRYGTLNGMARFIPLRIIALLRFTRPPKNPPRLPKRSYTMLDFAKSDRQQLISRTHLHTSLEAKRERALAYLGDKWVLHAKHAVKKNPQPGILIRIMQ